MAAIQPIKLWRWQDGTAGVDNLYGATVGGDGAIVLTGRTQGDWDDLNAGDFDFMAVKFASDGTEKWRFQAGTVEEDIFNAGASVAASASSSSTTGSGSGGDGSVLVGSTRGGWNDSANAGESDFVAAKLSPEGTLVWIWQDGTPANDTMVGVVACSSDEVVVAGRTNGDWDGTNSGGTDVAVTKLAVGNGTEVWRYQVGSDQDDISKSVAAGSDGSVVVAGYTEGDLGGSNAGGTDFFAIKLHANGSEAWTWQGGTDGDDYMYSVVVGNDGSVVVAGYTAGSWACANLGEVDFAAVKLDKDGKELWRWQEGTPLKDKIFAAVATEDGSVVLAGYTEGYWAGPSAGGSDLAAVKLSPDGGISWRWQDGTSESDWVTSAAISKSSGSVILAGSSKGLWQAADGCPAGLDDFVAVALEVGGTVVGASSTLTPTPASAAYDVSSASGSWTATAILGGASTAPPSPSIAWGSASTSQTATADRRGTSSSTTATTGQYMASGSAEASFVVSMSTPAPSSDGQGISTEPPSLLGSGDGNDETTTSALRGVSSEDTPAPSAPPPAPSQNPHATLVSPSTEPSTIGEETIITQDPVSVHPSSIPVPSPTLERTTSGGREIVAEPSQSFVSADGDSDDDETWISAPHGISLEGTSAPSAAPTISPLAPYTLTASPSSSEPSTNGAGLDFTQAPESGSASSMREESPISRSTASCAIFAASHPSSAFETLLLVAGVVLFRRLFTWASLLK